MSTFPGLVPKLKRRAIADARRPSDGDGDITTGQPRSASALVPPTLLSNPVRRSSADGEDRLGGEPVPAAIETVLRRRRGTGASLPDALAQDLSSGFGADLSGVRVHTDPEAARISGQLDAVAFTRGHDIYFATGAYRPDSAPGRHLLAHELAHVVQQRSTTAGSGPRGVVGRAHDPAERQADELAARVARRPVTRAPAGEQRSELPIPASANQAGLVQRYVVADLKTKEKKLHRELRAKYVKLNGDDEDHYGPKFDDKADSATTVTQMETFVATVEAEMAARKLAVLVPARDPSPGPKPAASTPTVVHTGPAKKEKPSVTTFTLGPRSYTPVVAPVIDPYAGLSSKVRALAVKIKAWPTNIMDGTTAPLSASERIELRTWVELQETPSGIQKYVVNIGPGTGTYTGTTQFKVTGFGDVDGKAPTYHITL